MLKNIIFFKKRFTSAPLLPVQIKKGAGFTLIEVIIAVTLVTVGLIAALNLIFHAISITSSARGKLIASQLAQEGIEVVRNIRDINWIEGRDWLEGLNNQVTPRNFIPVFSGDTPDNPWFLTELADDSVDNNWKKVYFDFDPDNRFYGQKAGDPIPLSWQEEPFKRWLELSYDNSQGSLIIVSHVDWRERGNWHPFEIKDYLYNWQTSSSGFCPSGYTEINGSSQRYFEGDSKQNKGISYYSDRYIDPADPEGDEVDGGPCSGQEMILDEDYSQGALPYREDTSRVCISDSPESLTFRSQRESQSICESVGEQTVNARKVIDPL